MWTEDLSVNDLSIDNEHKHLFDLIDNFYKSIKDNSPKERLEELILGLVDYTKTHFANEEAYMQKMNYPDLEAHKRLHDAFIDKVHNYYERLKGGKLILSIEVTNFLKDWLTNHIKGTDQQYVLFEESKLQSQAL